MKEMTWTREEAKKRLAIIFHSTKHAMESQAIEAVTVPDRRLRERHFAEACEKSDVLVGILMSAEAIGIDKEEITDMKVSDEEKEAFMDAFHEKCARKAKERMPGSLGEILAEILG